MPEPDTMQWTRPLVRAAALDKQRTSMWNEAQFGEVMRVAGIGAGARIVDVGAGSGGMLELFGDVLAANAGARLTCVDREPTLAAATAARAATLGIADRVDALVGDAAQLPLPSGCADLVFCQTVLMHVADAAAVVRELVRIARPGAAVVIVEGNAIVRPNLLARVAPEVAATIFGLWHRIRVGRRALGRGDLAIGEEVPALLAAAGATLAAVRLVDRVLVPGPDLIAMLDRAAPVFAAWRPGFAEAFVEAGGSLAEFDAAWAVWRAAEDALAADVRAGTYPGVLAGLLYAFVATTDRAPPAAGSTVAP